jgi:hypothetical protein
VLPPEVRLVALPPAEAKLQALVQEQVAEILARREDLIFQPYFQSRRVAQELLKLKSIPERRAWSVRYDRKGCSHCKTKKRPHSSCGMCLPCKVLISEELKAIDRELSKRG